MSAFGDRSVRIEGLDLREVCIAEKTLSLAGRDGSYCKCVRDEMRKGAILAGQ